MKNTPTTEQIEALKAFAKHNGRTWKAVLRDIWMAGGYDSERGEYVDAPLMQLRNNEGFGPSAIRLTEADLKRLDNHIEKSVLRLAERFGDYEETARVYLEGRLWPSGPVCPDCKSGDKVSALGTCATRKPGFYRCLSCAFDFTVRTNTIFERSKVPLHKWVYAMYLLVTSRKGISSMQLAKEIGVTQKTAWFILGRLREACGNQFDPEPLRGVVEVDETFAGGKEKNKHARKKLNAGRGSVGKVAVLGMRERGGFVRAKVVDATDINTVQNEIHGTVEVGSTIYTDEYGAYSDLDGLFFRHATVNHGAGEFVRGRVHTNGIESVWAVLKRGLHGVYHHASAKHLFRYVDEFTFRLNEGNVANHTTERLDSFVDATAGKRLTYRRLCA